MKNDLFKHFFICFIVTEALNLPRNTVIVSLSLLVANILLVVLIEDLDTLLRNFILMGGFLKLGLLDLDWVGFWCEFWLCLIFSSQAILGTRIMAWYFWSLPTDLFNCTFCIWKYFWRFLQQIHLVVSFFDRHALKNFRNKKLR